MVSAKFTDESMGLKRTKAMCAARRKTLLVAAMERMAGRKRRRDVEEPGDGGADEEGNEGERGGKAEGGEGGAGEVEEVRHGEGVVADVAVGEEIADVGDEGEVAAKTRDRRRGRRRWRGRGGCRWRR